MSRGGRPRERASRRTCLGCRAVREKGALSRLAVTPSGVTVDHRQVLPGRGAYVCRSEACATKASRAVSKALRSPGLEVSPGWLWQALRDPAATALEGAAPDAADERPGRER